MNSKKKNSLFFYFILFITISTIAVIELGQLAPFDLGEGEVYIQGNDVIKNFKIESFDSESLNSDGSIPGNSRIRFDKGSFWTSTRDDFKILQIYNEGNDIYFDYTVDFRNKINSFTTADIETASGGIHELNERFAVSKYFHRGWAGNIIEGPHYNYLNWKHYHFGQLDREIVNEINSEPIISDIDAAKRDTLLSQGNLYDYNAQYNRFSGPIKLSFDVKQNPLPQTINFTGGGLNKIYDYIGISEAYVSKSTVGSLTDNDELTIQEFTPAEYSIEKNENNYNADWFTEKHGVSLEWKPNIQTLDGTIETAKVDFNVIPHTNGASLNPVQKSGAPLFNPRTQEESIDGCILTYSLNRISPVVTEYSKRLTFTLEQKATRDELQYVLPFGVRIVVKPSDFQEWSYTYTRPVGLKVTNRYIQSEIVIRFRMWSKFELSSNSQDIELGLPEEYHDNIVWSSIIDGFGGGITQKAGYDIIGGLGISFGMLFAIILIGLGIYLAYKIIKNRNAGRPIFYGINPIKKSK